MPIVTDELGNIISSTPNNNDQTGESDDEYSYDKAYAAKLTATKELNNITNQLKTKNESFAGSTPAGQSDKGSTNKVQSSETSTGPKPGQRLKNPLANFSSYTYQITLYMITPDAYDAFIQSGRTNINAINNAANDNAAVDINSGQSGAYIVAQSGGINNKTSKRAFDLDFYIDDLKIKTSIAGKATQTASNDTGMTFNIYEPYGFSFISKITRAAQLLQKTSKIKNYRDLSNASKQFFVLGVRFQGYDVNGNLISASENFNQDTFNVTGDSGGVFERFYDIYITSIKFKLDGKMTVYSITAATVAPKAGFGTKFGRIDKGASVVGTNVLEALTGTKGLLTSLNEQQVLQAKESGEGSIANVYKLEFLGTSKKEIGDASIVSLADLDKSKWPMSMVSNTKQVNESVSVKSVPDSNKRSITFSTGISVMQAVGSIISQSSYLEDALNAILISDAQPNNDGTGENENPNPNPLTIKWYNLGTRVKVLGFDTVVKDFAYEITYVIQPYETPFITSPYASKTSKYYGPHKRYEYYFTGQNSEIINYEQKLDNAYFTVALNPSGSSASTGGGQDVPSLPGKRQNEDRTGKLDVGKEAQNSYLTSLFDPGSYANAKVSILGDPDFLMQDSPSSINNVYRQFYGTGFTINPNGGQVFIEIDFKEAQDYDNESGLMTINESILFWKYPKEVSAQVKGISYQVVMVESSFSKGKFTQDLSCVINTFPGISSDANKSGAARENTATNATTDTRTGIKQGQTSSNPSTNKNSDLVKDNSVSSDNLGNSGSDSTNPNNSPNAASESNDDNIVNRSKQPANEGGRDTETPDESSRNRLFVNGLGGV